MGGGAASRAATHSASRCFNFPELAWARPRYPLYLDCDVVLRGVLKEEEEGEQDFASSSQKNIKTTTRLY